MLKSISWPEYLLAVSLIASAYYAVIIALFYSRDIAAKIKGAAVPKTHPVVEPPRGHVESFMGPILKDVPRKALVSQSVAAAEEITVEQERQSLADLIIDELHAVFVMLSEGPVEKSTYSSSIKKIIGKYWMHKGSPVQAEVATYITDHFTGNTEISFSVQEIDILWPAHDLEENQSTTINSYETEKKNDRKG